MNLPTNKGFSLVEVLLSVAVFALVVTGLAGGLIYGQQSTVLAGERARAAMLADEGLEAVKNIKDENFVNLADGTYGLAISGNQWILSGTSDTTDIFTRQIVISTVDSKRKQVTANISWQQNPQRTGQLSATTYFANWTTVAASPSPTPTPTSTPTPTPTSTPTPTPTPTATPANCNQYCQGRYGTSGSCVKANQCSTHNEGSIYECLPPNICCCQ